MKSTPPLSAESEKQKSSKKPKSKHDGRVQHTNPAGLRAGINKLMNKILACNDPLSHAGQYASLANSMTNSQKLSFDINDFRKLQAEVEELKEKMKKE